MVDPILVARNVMFSGKQTTARKMVDQLRTVLIKEHMGFTITAHILQAQYELLTLTNVTIHYNKRLLETQLLSLILKWKNC